jgi:nanoRNase/pAp phosphatase (c-di-AMP/oligoRNAs hydrolase)
MIKQKIHTIQEKNIIVDNIINALVENKGFLICGHSSPDEDCISSMVAFSLLANRFDKLSQIYIGGKVPENLDYLLQICKYNSIKILHKRSTIAESIDTIVICDTPKPSMLDINSKIKDLMKTDILKIEIDHHLGGDSEYIGDEGYRLVTEASSAAELIGFLAMKLSKGKEILRKFMISDPFSRNLVLSIITGIVGDTNMGQFLKSKSEKKYYDIFSKMFNNLLMKTTVKENYFSRIDQVFEELQKHTEMEEQCFNYVFQKHEMANSIGYVILNQKDAKKLFKDFDEETIITVSRSVANELAEKSGKLSLIAYYDDINHSNYIQFRMRRSHSFKTFDLREVLKMFSIENGGGHEGAIGFRISRDSIDDLKGYVKNLVHEVEQVLP